MNPVHQSHHSHAAAEPVREYLRDVSLETIDHVQALGLSLFLEKKPKLSEKERDRQVLALIWLLSKCNDESDIADAVEDSPARAWSEIDVFRRDPRALWALPEVVPAVQKVREILSRNHFLAAAEAAADDGAEGHA